MKFKINAFASYKSISKFIYIETAPELLKTNWWEKRFKSPDKIQYRINKTCDYLFLTEVLNS